LINCHQFLLNIRVWYRFFLFYSFNLNITPSFLALKNRPRYNVIYHFFQPKCVLWNKKFLLLLLVFILANSISLLLLFLHLISIIMFLFHFVFKLHPIQLSFISNFLLYRPSLKFLFDIKSIFNRHSLCDIGSCFFEIYMDLKRIYDIIFS
jgi:hypothetical protein